MKKVLLSAFLFTAGLLQAQIEVTTRGEVPVVDGETYNFTTLDHFAEMPLIVTNVSEQDINLKIRVEEIINADGEDVQLCFGGLCLYNVAVGNVYPPNFPAFIAPGESNMQGDHMWNFNAGINTSEPVVYRLAFIQLDDNGEVVDTLLTFTYQYTPELSTGDFNQLGVTQINTLVNESIAIQTIQPIKLSVFNMNGQLVQNAAVEAGQTNVDVAGLARGLYIVQMENQAGTAKVKVLKQ